MVAAAYLFQTHRPRRLTAETAANRNVLRIRGQIKLPAESAAAVV
jgi:hypothetical protein